MRLHRLIRLRNHLPVLLIVPLVVILMTWPTFVRLFDHDEFWLHVQQRDKWQKFWDAWHLERVLAGQADLFYTDAQFHPNGVSLVWQAIIYPHAALLALLQDIIAADSAYNLLFLLILSFNAFCAYLLMHHLTRDKWIALFGAVGVCVSTPFPHASTSPDLILIGTLPLSLYYLHRAVTESRWRFAAAAGLCAGLTAFISLYTLVLIMFTVGILALYWALSRWRRPAFWGLLLLFALISASIGLLRVYPIIADADVLSQGAAYYQDLLRSNDMLDYFVLSTNPLTEAPLRALFRSRPPRELTTPTWATPA